MKIEKDMDDIPPEMRCEIAAKSATALAVIYDLVFRKAMGHKYEAIELPIWREWKGG